MCRRAGDGRWGEREAVSWNCAAPGLEGGGVIFLEVIVGYEWNG